MPSNQASSAGGNHANCIVLAANGGGQPLTLTSDAQLRHANTAFTFDTYAHVLPHMQDEAAARTEAMLFGERA